MIYRPRSDILLFSGSYHKKSLKLGKKYVMHLSQRGNWIFFFVFETGRLDRVCH
jgi:hypothetical protein